jgi:hypothetical protein
VFSHVSTPGSVFHIRKETLASPTELQAPAGKTLSRFELTFLDDKKTLIAENKT